MAQINAVPKKAPAKVPAAKAFQAAPEICEMLQAIGEIQEFPRHTVLFEKGDHAKGVYVIRKGRVALSTGDDPCAITRIAEQGSLLGLPSTVGNRPYSLTAEAVTDVEVCHIPAAAFRKALASNAVLGMAIVKILSDEVSALRRFAVYRA